MEAPEVGGFYARGSVSLWRLWDVARGDVEVLSGRVLVSDCWRGYAVGPGAGSGAGCRPSAALVPRVGAQAPGAGLCRPTGGPGLVPKLLINEKNVPKTPLDEQALLLVTPPDKYS